MLSNKMAHSEIRYDFAVDLWSVGIFAYELNCGRAPFQDKTQAITHIKIWETNYEMPPEFSPELKSFLNAILKKDPAKRLTLQQMLEHAWLKKWEPKA
jgi:serine/threonine protein kinase